MKQSELLKVFSKLSDSQKERIIRELKDMILQNSQMEDSKPEVCPFCHKKTKLVKKGIESGKRNYFCKECRHRFTYDSHTITSCIKISKDELIEICLDTLNLVPIAKTAARLNRSVHCVFTNRHKFLCLLEDLLKDENILLEGTIEVDETYLLESEKGNKKLHLKRKARHRGEPSNLRGISHEQVCVVTTSDRKGHEIFKAVGHAKPTSDIIKETFGKSIGNQSIIYTDGISVYDRLASEKQCKIVHLEGHQSYNKVEHLNTVNCIHSMIGRNMAFYRGVASKYINRYNALFVLMREYQGMDLNEMTELLIKRIKSYPYIKRRKDLKTYHTFTLYADLA